MLLSANCRGDVTPLEFFLAGIRGWGGRPIRAQQTVDVVVVWLPSTHTKTLQATLTYKPAALEQSLRSPVVYPDKGVHAMDSVLSEGPLKDSGHSLAH